MMPCIVANQAGVAPRGKEEDCSTLDDFALAFGLNSHLLEYHNWEPIYADNLPSIIAMLSRTHLALF